VVANIPGRRSVLAGWLIALALAPLAGCNGLWDDITARGYFQEAFGPPPDPYKVLADPRSDGDQRHKALTALGQVDPRTLSPAEAENTLKILVAAAGTERHLWVRIAAVQALGNWDDARAVDGLKDAYYRAGAFPGDGGATLRVYTLTALGRCGHPTSVDILVKVLSAPPPAEGSETEKQQNLEERLAAARSLARYKSYQSTEALLEVLRKEQDPGLRNRSQESLAYITGRDLPPDAVVWEKFLHDPSSVPDKTIGERFREILPASWRGDR
jgi:hypothetical protein